MPGSELHRRKVVRWVRLAAGRSGRQPKLGTGSSVLLAAQHARPRGSVESQTLSASLGLLGAALSALLLLLMGGGHLPPVAE
jgi:hypothetical protein